jgi:hypothetical protein
VKEKGRKLFQPSFLDFVECLTDVVEDVLNVLNTDREADEVRCYTCLKQLLVGELTVGVTGGMEHTGAGIGHMGYDVDHL